MHTNKGIAHFDDGGRSRSEAAARSKAAADAAEVERKRAADWAAADAALVKQYEGKVPLSVAIKRASDWQQLNSTPKQGGRDGAAAKVMPDALAVTDTFKRLGVSEALIPERVDLGLYNLLQSKAGGRLDPATTFANSQRYADGRSIANDEVIPDLMARGLYQGKTGAELWKPIEAWNDSQRGKGQGLEGVQRFATNASQGIVNHPFSGPIITAVAQAYGIPPSVTSAALTAAKGGDPTAIARNFFTSYLGGQLGEAASGQVTDMLSNSNFDPSTIANIGKVTSGFTQGGVGTGTLEGAVKGGVGAGLTIGKNIAGKEISALAKDYGLDSISIPGFDKDGYKIAGSFDGPFIPGVSREDIQSGFKQIQKSPVGQLVAQTPGGKQVTRAVNAVKNVVPNAVNRVTSGVTNSVNDAVDRAIGGGESRAPASKTGGNGVNMAALLALLSGGQQQATQEQYKDVKSDDPTLAYLEKFAPDAGENISVARRLGIV